MTPNENNNDFLIMNYRSLTEDKVNLTLTEYLDYVFEPVETNKIAQESIKDATLGDINQTVATPEPEPESKIAKIGHIPYVLMSQNLQ
ncbi:hypothetical protein FQA39_LY18458 [Lamprigera yunnana]|nr:hypothetical protein FQA39_LY18458 [Lamprigera yunnana]